MAYRLIDILFRFHVFVIFIISIFYFNIRHKEILKRIGPAKRG